MRILFILFFTISISSLSGQDMRTYYAHTEQAKAQFINKNYEESSKNFELAFNSVGGKSIPEDRYEAARAFALAKHSDKAFYHLFYLAEHKITQYHELDTLKQDEAFNELHQFQQWNDLLILVSSNKVEYEKFLDKPLAAELEKIYELDQKYRAEFEEAEKTYGFESVEVKRIWKKINNADYKNLQRVKEILDERGWLGPKVVGNKGSQALFLVIQHSDHDTMKKYLPMMQEAVKKGHARATSLALMEDRVAIGDGKRQLYGSQIGRDPETKEHFVKPVMYPEQINEIRKSIGLPTIEEYVSQWGITWDIEKHKANTKKYEASNSK